MSDSLYSPRIHNKKTRETRENQTEATLGHWHLLSSWSFLTGFSLSDDHDDNERVFNTTTIKSFSLDSQAESRSSLTIQLYVFCTARLDFSTTHSMVKLESHCIELQDHRCISQSDCSLIDSRISFSLKGIWVSTWCLPAMKSLPDFGEKENVDEQKKWLDENKKFSMRMMMSKNSVWFIVMHTIKIEFPSAFCVKAA
jgi:hypothetical protein